jgi:4-carboxymuconolactone decarboxylase
MYPEDVDPESGCRLPLPSREQLDDAGQRTYDSLADPKGGTIRGLRGPGGIMLHSPVLSRHARPLNGYLRHLAGLGGRVRELAILTTARELDSQFEWAAHEPEALSEGISAEVIEVIKHRRDTNGLDEADAIVIELGREIFGARKVASATFARALQPPSGPVDARPAASCFRVKSLGSSRSIARFRRIPCLSALNSQPASS